MKLEAPIMAALMVLLFLIGGVAVINDQVITYDVNVTNRVFQNLSEQYEEVFNTSASMEEARKPGEVGTVGALDSLISGVFNVIQYIGQSIAITFALVTEIGKVIGIPPVIISIFFVMIGIAITFAIVALIFRFQNR